MVLVLVTKYAKKILEIVESSNDHLTAEQIFMQLRETYPTVVLATVYNNLASLYAKGLIRKVAVPGFPDRYDNVTRHDHLVCQNCGRLVDVSLEDFTESIQRDSGAQIISYDLNVTYLCPECTEARVGKDALHN